MVLAFTGKNGSGKTYFAVYNIWLDWLNGTDVCSNTILFFDKFPFTFIDKWYQRIKRIYCWLVRREYILSERGKIKYFEDIMDIIHVRDCIVFFDEAGVLLSNRGWEKLPDEFIYKVQQQRKHGLDLYATVPNMASIDIVYRRLVQKWYHMQNIVQLGFSPRVLFQWVRVHEKDINQLHTTTDDVAVDNISSFNLYIHRWSRRLYDTMFDIGFRRFKVCWLKSYDKNLNSVEKFYIIPKSMSISKANQVSKLY